jgi:outer membrane protein assembly factor BamB
MAGECHAPLCAADGCVLAADNDGKQDFWQCFNAADGRLRWSCHYSNAEKMDYGAGPRAAPWIDGGRAFCLSAWGELLCLRMADGSVIWRKHLAKEFGQKTPNWGYTTSPLLADGKLLVSPGGKGGPVVALDPQTGTTLWTGAGRGLNYANLSVGDFGGVAQVLGYDERTAGAWELKTGRRLWTLRTETAAGYVVPSPVTVGDRLLLSSDQEGARLFAFDSAGAIQPRPAAVNEDVAPDVSTPTVWGDAILCASSGLVLMDALPSRTKGVLKTLWIYDAEECVKGICHAIVSQDRALVMCDDGQVLLLSADRKACRILDRAKLCEKTWVYPALAGGRFFARDHQRLYCYQTPVAP